MIKESRVEMTGNVFKIRKRTPSFAQNAWLCLAVVSPRKGIFKLGELKRELIGEKERERLPLFFPIRAFLPLPSPFCACPPGIFYLDLKTLALYYVTDEAS